MPRNKVFHLKINLPNLELFNKAKNIPLVLQSSTTITILGKCVLEFMTYEQAEITTL